nr:MAG TPA: hypothetical protein [Caudoviricetes sp.]
MLWKLGIFFIAIGLIKLCCSAVHVLMKRRDNNADR